MFSNFTQNSLSKVTLCNIKGVRNQWMENYLQIKYAQHACKIECNYDPNNSVCVGITKFI